MYAKIVNKYVTKARIILTKDNLQRLCREFDITANVAYRYLTDIYNENITAKGRNEVLVAAINRYGGKIAESQVRKDVVEIDIYDDPLNH